MMASSTTMPMAIVSASSVKMLIEKPRKYMMAKVETIDAGIASPGITVARRFRRNTKMISTTRMAAIKSVRRASLIECVTNTDPSHAISSFTPGGSVCWMPGIASDPPSDVDQVRLGLPDHADRDRGIPVVAEDRAIVLGPELDVRHVLELDDLPALTRHRHLPESLRRLELAQGPDRELPSRRFDA